MHYTILVATKRHAWTQEMVLNDLTKKIEGLTQIGWKKVGDIMYFKNAVTQIIVPIETTDKELALMMPVIEKQQELGSNKPKILTYEMGGAGHMGVKTLFDSGTYYDI